MSSLEAYQHGLECTLHICLKGMATKHVTKYPMLSYSTSYSFSSGRIPPGISSLTYLSSLDLSYNNLSRKIPSNTQLQSFDASSFIGNELCGPPLPMNCEGDQIVPTAENGGQKEGFTTGTNSS
ncbi:hypothetical protein FEM48_Zijuj03G0195000 [Ziziphus jujuba var. spinosa]|uniref:Uncharacterized protein n=1 Tax=Ziziphus jujuba var. spinosa TaxID=714518 RepID=A0A978VS70_ZIZJJ|nr:hypothetical protein FEM48_Zijuj03G0195000 [Ziziphus jujuba var. spinosa]